MNTTQNTRKVLLTVALAAFLGVGLGGCAAQSEIHGFADRRSSDVAHEVARAENRVQAAQLPETSPYAYRDQAERTAAKASPLNDDDPRGLHGVPTAQ